jgi:phage/plasmid-like protein (TIGR03299 family)
MAGTAVEGSVPVDATKENRPDLFGTRGQLGPDGGGGITSYMLADKPEYATPADSKVESGFYVGSRGLPWHVTLARALGERDLMDDAGGLLTAEQAVAAAGGNYEVTLHPVFTDTGILLPRTRAAVREDTGAVIGSVGNAYKVFQNIEIAELADAIVATGEAKYETGGVMKGGALFFLSMELNHLDIEVPGDPNGLLKTYLLANTSHDGSRPAGIYKTQVRTVCRNTENLAVRKAISAIKFRHVGDLSGRAAEARRVLNITFKDAVAVKEIVTKLATTKIVDDQVREILNRVWPVEEGAEEPVSRAAKKAFEVYESSASLEGIRGNTWGAYNAITEYLDHFADYRGGNLRNESDRKAESLLFGPASRSKSVALKELLKV